MSDPWLALGYGLLIGLIAYRVWRFLVRDEITGGFYARITGFELSTDTFSRPRLNAFLDCPWCFGGWIAIGLTFVFSLLVDGSGWVVIGIVATTVTGTLGERAL